MQQLNCSVNGSVNPRNGQKGFGLIGCLLSVFLMSAPVTVMAMEYGETGPYNVSRDTISNPLSGADVTVFMPANSGTKVPVMFFSHGYGGNYYQAYKPLCTHVASQGVAVVFSPYPSSAGWSQQYDILWAGFERAADVYSDEFDLDNVGYFGHSWGGGATPNMAYRGTEKGWGKDGMLMFLMAPGPANGMTDSQLRSLDHGNLIVQTFQNDTIVPESLAEDIYDEVGISSADKAYYFIYGGDHTEPSARSTDDYDELAIWTPLDALMDYTFELDNPAGGRAFALDGAGDHWNTDVEKDYVEEEPPVSEDPPVTEEPGWTSWRDRTSGWSWGWRR